MLKRDEFPQWVGCIAVKELRQGLRRGLFTIPFAIVHILAIVTILIDALNKRQLPYFEFSALINPLMFIPINFNPFSCGALWALIPLTCCGLIPCIAISMMSQELEQGNNELLMLTRLKRPRIVVEKFLAAWALCLLMLVSLLPYTLIPYLLNGMRLMVLGELLFSVACFSAVMCAMVIAASGYQRIQYRILFFLLFGFVAVSCLSTCFFKAKVSDGLIWHSINTAVATFSLVLLGLSSAKAQLKLTRFFYEIKPTTLLCVLLFLTPVVSGFVGVLTFGYISSLGYLGMGILCWFVDEPTRSRKQLARKSLNIPEAAKLLD